MATGGASTIRNRKQPAPQVHRRAAAPAACAQGIERRLRQRGLLRGNDSREYLSDVVPKRRRGGIQVRLASPVLCIIPEPDAALLAVLSSALYTSALFVAESARPWPSGCQPPYHRVGVAESGAGMRACAGRPRAVSQERGPRRAPHT